MPQPEIRPCGLCGEDYKTCPHPWHLPFDQRPYEYRKELDMLSEQFKRWSA